METIKRKIQELLQVSSEDLIGNKDFLTRFDTKLNKQEELINELRVLARAQNTLLGRTQRFPMADSYALYLITKVNKKTVELTWLNYCDAWVDDRVGYKGNISRDYVQRQKNFDDLWADEADKKRKAIIVAELGVNKTSGKEFTVTAEE